MTRLCNQCSLDFMMPLTTWTFRDYLWFLVVSLPSGQECILVKAVVDQ